MKPQQIYEELKNLAERLGIQVKEENFRNTGIAVQSGLCKIKGQLVFVMDKHESTKEKISHLVQHINRLPQGDIENIYIIPAVRDLLKKSDAGRRAGVIEKPRSLETHNDK